MAVGLEQARVHGGGDREAVARQGPGAREIADQEPGPRPGEQGREGPAGVVEQEQGTPHLDGADRGQVAAEDDRRRVPRRGGCPAKARARAGARAGQEDHPQAVDGQADHARNAPRPVLRASRPDAGRRGASATRRRARAPRPRRHPQPGAGASAVGWSWSRAGRRALHPGRRRRAARARGGAATLRVPRRREAGGRARTVRDRRAWSRRHGRGGVDRRLHGLPAPSRRGARGGGRRRLRQLAWSLRTDQRVTVLDRTNVRDLRPEDMPYAPAIVVADLLHPAPPRDPGARPCRVGRRRSGPVGQAAVRGRSRAGGFGRRRPRPDAGATRSSGSRTQAPSTVSRRSM